MDHGLVSDGPVALQDLLAAQAQGEPGLQIGVGQWGDGGVEDGPRVVLGLQESGDVGGDRRVQRGGVVLEFGDVDECGRQESAVLLPPAPVPLVGHAGEQVDEAGVRAAVVERQGADAFGADPEAARLDVGDAGAVDAQEGGGLLGRHPRLFAQFAQFAP